MKRKRKISFFFIYHLLLQGSFIHNKTGKKEGGGLRFLTGRTQEGGGESLRCVLCATGGVGGSKNREKMRM